MAGGFVRPEPWIRGSDRYGSGRSARGPSFQFGNLIRIPRLMRVFFMQHNSELTIIKNLQ